MIDGIWWLVILAAVVAALWTLAQRRGAHSNNTKQGNTSANSKLPVNDALQKTEAMLKQSFTDYRVTRRANHLLITRHGKKMAMITIDKSISVGQRRLGDVPIINYHRIPSRAQLSANLQDAE